ncbi:hypothetical protein IU471_26625, partial [Nocardia elegans]|uniref:DUF6285 domain-containing protein n=1 Tax=Nocardia elegans TaxID=300029 RepID=UPI002B4B360A
MQNRPSAAELLESLAELLEDTLLPALPPALQHRARVGANLARIVRREVELGPQAAERERALLAAVPASLAAEVARVLIRAGDHVTLSRVVGAVPEQVLRAALPLAEDTDLLRVGFLLEDKSGTDRLVDLVADRIPGLVRAAADHGLWAEAIDLLDTVSPANRARIGDI